MEQLMVERKIEIDAPRERIWQALTEPEQLAQWLLPPAMGAAMKRDDRGKLYVSMGPMEAVVAQVEDAAAPARLTLRGLPDGRLAAQFTLDETGGGTRVTVTLTGLDRLPEEARRERVPPSDMAWQRALENLKAYLAGRELPYPEGYVGALFGYRREAKERFAIERSIWIKASRARVWQAITDPEQIRQWFAPSMAWELTAEGLGGVLTVRDPETGDVLDQQVIVEIEPPHRLATRSNTQPPAPVYVTSYVLEEENGGTRLTLTHAGYELEPEDGRWNSMEQNTFGFGMMLENVKAVAEGESLPYPGGF